MAFYAKFLLFCCSLQIITTYNIYFTRAFNLSELKGSLPHPSVISRMFSEFLGPVLRSLPQNNLLNNDFKEPLVLNAIKQKIEDLQPLLQDNDVIPEKLMLEDKNDTTIIEFLPKTDERNKKLDGDSLKSQIKKYKKIREKINKALTKESVSVKTKSLIVKTLDGLIKSLLSSQCKWKRNLRAAKTEKPLDIAKKWNIGLQRIREVFLNFVKKKSAKSRRNDVLNFLDAVQIMFRSVTEDVDAISKKYRILCDFIPKEHMNYAVKHEDMNANALRNRWDKTDLEEDRCQNVVVCSNELKEFMINFFYSLNDTAVSVLKNYIEMYTRDVKGDNENEEDVIISILNKIITGLKEGMPNEFIRETQNLRLDEGKNNQANVKAMTDYVTNTIENVKSFAKQLLKSELLVLRENKFSIILDDLNVNLDVDLGNLEREFVRKICDMFRLCNGKYRGRRHGSSNTNKNLYIQLELTLDDDNMTNINSHRKFLSASPKNSTLNILKSFVSNVIVTRTTLIHNVTNYKRI